MKKFLLAFCMITCLLSLTACSKEAASDDPFAKYSKEDLQSTSDNLMEQLAGFDDAYLDSMIEQGDAVSAAAAESWKNIKGDVGEFQKVKSFDMNKSGEQLSTVWIGEFSKRDVKLTVTYDKEMSIVSISPEAVYTMGDRMGKAALNTLLGMGTVFVVLILISLLISCFKYINRLEDKMNKRKAEKKEQAVLEAPAEAKAVEPEENPADDLELVAVITAAIAASEGTSTDGFVVRSIKKRTKWQRA